MAWIYIGFSVAAALALIASAFMNGWYQAVLISFSINIITSIAIVLLVNKAIDRHAQALSEAKEKEIERQQILNAHKIIKCLLPAYIIEFNQLTTPLKKRTCEGKYEKIECEKFNSEIVILNMIDMFSTDITVYGRMSNTILESYRQMDNQIIQAFQNVLIKCSFAYFPNVLDAINKIIQDSLQPSSLETLIGFAHDKAIHETVKGMMENYTGNPVEDVLSQKYSGNLFLHPLLFMFYLQRMKISIENYLAQIGELSKESANEISIQNPTLSD